jgi:hypothetical protein
VQPSSLVFLVVIGVWAAYFVQYWVRRREHLATVRSVDQFSESMRILEREAKEEGAAPGARPHLLARRVAAAESKVTESEIADSEVAGSGRNGGGSQRRGASRRVCGLGLLAALLTLVVVASLAALGMVPVIAVAAPVLALVAAFAMLRRAATRDRAARRTVRGVRPMRVGVEAVVLVEAPAAVPVTAPVAKVVDQAPSRPELFDVQSFEPAPPAAAAPVHEPVLEVVAVPLVGEDDIPLTWDPRPVPRPTYTMKSRVTRPAPTAADLVGDADTEYAAYEEPAPSRRVAGA